MRNWVGYVDQVYVADDGTVDFEVDIDGAGNEVQTSDLGEGRNLALVCEPDWEWEYRPHQRCVDGLRHSIG